MRAMVLCVLWCSSDRSSRPPLFDGFAAWRARHRDSMESFEFFAGGGGGFGVVNVADEATLNQIMVEHPLLPFSEVEVHPLVDGDTALDQWRQTLQQMMGDAS